MNEPWNSLFRTWINFWLIHWKDWCWSWNSKTLATSCEELTHWKRPWCWEGLGAGGEGDDRGWDGWMASPTRCTWVWVDSGSWWWTGRPGVLRFMGLQSRTRLSDWTELNFISRIQSFEIPSSCCITGDGICPSSSYAQPLSLLLPETNWWGFVQSPVFSVPILPAEATWYHFQILLILSQGKKGLGINFQLSKMQDQLTFISQFR